jgi:hypothetical protein
MFSQIKTKHYKKYYSLTCLFVICDKKTNQDTKGVIWKETNAFMLNV